MLSAALLLLASFTTPAEAAADPLVKDYLKDFDADCTAHACGAELESCDGPHTDCAKRAACVKEGHMESCFKDMHWSELSDTEVQVFDCAHKHWCMPNEYGGEASSSSSFVELLASEKQRRGLSKTQAQRDVSTGAYFRHMMRHGSGLERAATAEDTVAQETVDDDDVVSKRVEAAKKKEKDVQRKAAAERQAAKAAEADAEARVAQAHFEEVKAESDAAKDKADRTAQRAEKEKEAADAALRAIDDEESASSSSDASSALSAPASAVAAAPVASSSSAAAAPTADAVPKAAAKDADAKARPVDPPVAATPVAASPPVAAVAAPAAKDAAKTPAAASETSAPKAPLALSKFDAARTDSAEARATASQTEAAKKPVAASVAAKKDAAGMVDSYLTQKTPDTGTDADNSEDYDIRREVTPRERSSIRRSNTLAAFHNSISRIGTHSYSHA